MENGNIIVGGRVIDYEYDFDPTICRVIVDGQLIDLDDEDDADMIDELTREIVVYANSLTMDVDTLIILRDLESYLQSNDIYYKEQIN